MDCIVHGVAKNRTPMSNFQLLTINYLFIWCFLMPGTGVILYSLSFPISTSLRGGNYYYLHFTDEN